MTRIFGSDEWQSEFYRENKEPLLFDMNPSQDKTVDLDRIGKFFLKRLQTIFAKVAENPRPLLNSTNHPIYLLCFAAGNPKGAATAVKSAQDILRK